MSVQSCDKNGETSTSGCYSIAVNKRRVGKMIHFPVEIRTHHSNCVNTERRLDKREVMSRALLLLKLTEKLDKYIRSERQKRERMRLKARHTLARGDDEGQ